MARITVEDCLQNIDNLFDLVMVAAKRARRLANGAEPMVELAKGLCRDGHFLQGVATDLPVEDLSFDVVTASQLLCFVSEADKALSEMFRA